MLRGAQVRSLPADEADIDITARASDEHSGGSSPGPSSPLAMSSTPLAGDRIMLEDGNSAGERTELVDASGSPVLIDGHPTRKQVDHIWFLRTPQQQKRFLIIGTIVMLLVAVVFGLLIHRTPDIPHPWNRVSSVCGWTYFFVWSVSFYPQVYLNWRRRSVEGLSIDYEAYNLLGFVAYTIFNCAFHWSDPIKREYIKRNHGHTNRVDLNDVVFAIHAVILTLFTIYQIFIYDRAGQKISPLAKWSTSIAWVVCGVYALLVFLEKPKEPFTWYYYVYFMSYIKLVISFVKYCPQVYLNYSRKSTYGWNIWNVLLDFTGGFLSVAQLVMDSGLNGDWGGIWGDPVKFGLGILSMVFDVIFMVQHYILYPESHSVASPRTASHGGFSRLDSA